MEVPHLQDLDVVCLVPRFHRQDKKVGIPRPDLAEAFIRTVMEGTDNV
jgi:hypothetical protein